MCTLARLLYSGGAAAHRHSRLRATVLLALDFSSTARSLTRASGLGAIRPSYRRRHLRPPQCLLPSMVSSAKPALPHSGDADPKNLPPPPGRHSAPPGASVHHVCAIGASHRTSRRSPAALIGCLAGALRDQSHAKALQALRWGFVVESLPRTAVELLRDAIQLVLRVTAEARALG
jgi:hypothetical protein